jgi:transposase
VINTFARLCREADKRQRRKPIDPRIEKLRKLLADDISLERAYGEIYAEHFRGRAAGSTVDALVYQLRKGGAALSDPNARQRLAELSEQQMHEVSARLQKFMPHVARPWTPDEVEVFVELWSALHG